MAFFKLHKLRNCFKTIKILKTVTYKNRTASRVVSTNNFFTKNKAGSKTQKKYFKLSLLHYMVARAKTDNPINAEIDPFLFLVKHNS